MYIKSVYVPFKPGHPEILLLRILRQMWMLTDVSTQYNSDNTTTPGHDFGVEWYLGWREGRIQRIKCSSPAVNMVEKLCELSVGLGIWARATTFAWCPFVEQPAPQDHALHPTENHIRRKSHTIPTRAQITYLTGVICTGDMGGVQQDRP